MLAAVQFQRSSLDPQYYPRSARLLRRTATSINTFDELKAYRQFNTGAPTRGTSSFIDSAILKNMLSVAIHHVMGYARGAEQLGANWTATCGASSSGFRRCLLRFQFASLAAS
jgi:hypothetical protein